MRSLDAKKKLGGDGTFEVQRSAIDAPALTMYACGLCLTGLRDAPTPAGVPLEAVHVKKGDVLRVVAAAADEASAAPPIYEGRCVSASASEFTFRLDDPRLDVAIDRGAAVFRVAAEGSWALAGLHLGHVDGHFTETDRWLHAARPIAPLVDSLAEYWVAERQRRISALRTRREIVKPIDYRRIAGIAGRAKLREFVSIRAAQRRVALEGPPQRAPPRTADGPQRRVVVPAHVKLASTPLPDIANDDEAAAFCAGALGKSTAVLLDVLDKYPADADVQVAGLRAMAGEISTRTGDADALAALGAEVSAAAVARSPRPSFNHRPSPSRPRSPPPPLPRARRLQQHRRSTGSGDRIGTSGTTRCSASRCSRRSTATASSSTRPTGERRSGTLWRRSSGTAKSTRRRRRPSRGRSARPPTSEPTSTRRTSRSRRPTAW